MKKSVKAAVAAAVICICVCAAVLTLRTVKNHNSSGDKLPEETGVSAPQPEDALYVASDGGFKISAPAAYSGAYVEDGSDEPVENVACVIIKNDSGKDCRYAEISVTTADKTYEFVITTLKNGECLTALEKNRSTLGATTGVKNVTVSKNAGFEEPPGLYEDVFELTVFDGVLNIRNVSGTDITEPVRVCYKNLREGGLFGGITYRITIDSLKAGELKQASSRHLSKENSVLEFITYVH